MATTFFTKSLASVATLTIFATLTQAIPYRLTQNFAGPTFFDNFDFITSEPTGGWVSYLDQATAQGLGYASASPSGAYLGVDHVSVLNPAGAGRRSIRIESKLSFNQGLIIGDFAHMPAGCGLWPAFWVYGPNWPNSGEIDILEGVNSQAVNQISAHTAAGCTIAGGQSKANLIQNVCYQPVTNSGCYFKSNGPFSYGQNFNNVGGGVYAMQWTNNWISVWFFRRGTVPADINANVPNPATWGRPMAMFAGSGCSIGSHFANMKIVVNTDFCGDWAGATFAQQGCGPSCVNYVAGNPGAFANAYWHINSIRVFQPNVSPARFAVFSDFDDTANSTTIDTSASPDDTIPDATSSAAATTTYAVPSAFLPSSLLSFSTETPLASIISVSAPDDAMGATISPSIGPTPDPTSVPTLITSLVSNPVTSATAGATATADGSSSDRDTLAHRRRHLAAHRGHLHA